MHLDLSPRQCVSCPAKPPACTCSADESCVQISQSCNACPTFTCQPSSSNSGGGTGGISSGALGGAIAAVLLVLLGAVIVFFLYRRRQRARQSRDAIAQAKPDIPAPAEAVLNRPDPTENLEKSQPPPTTPTLTNTVRIYSSTGDSVIDLDPHSQSSLTPTAGRASGRPSTGNPFDDGQSIQTTSTTTNGTNVIPIALVSPGSVPPSSPSKSHSFPPNSPARPARPSEDLVLDSPQHSLNTLHEPSPNYARSQRSDLSRMSYASNASYSSDFLNEAPMIVTHTRGAVRQVVGKVRAEVIQTPGSATPTSCLSSDSLKIPSTISRPSIRSPLAATSFGPADIVGEAEEEPQFSPRSAHSDPFGDHHTPSEQPLIVSTEDLRVRSNMGEPGLPAQLVGDGNTMRTNNGPLSPSQKSQHGSSTAKVLPSSPTPGTLQEQQQRALAHAQAQARAQGLDKFKRVSGTSVVSTTSTRADSILESFPFVPPSPISSRPVRSPPRSPLGQQFSAATQPQASSVVQSALPLEAGTTEVGAPFPPLDPPDRRVLGMSTGSQLSTASSGLGNFPFQIDHGGTEATQPPSASQARQRASLDTLALMSDLSSYPLGYDRDDHDSLPALPKS